MMNTQRPHSSCASPLATLLIFFLSTFVLSACSEDLPPPMIDGGTDAPFPDAGSDMPILDAGPDAPVLDAGPDAPIPDAGPDMPILDAGDDMPILDAGDDAGTCECPMDTECLTYACVAAECIPSYAAFGTDCGELSGGVLTGICSGAPSAAPADMEGMCITRGCGDGFVESGPSDTVPRPAAESCDDGNLDDGDACSAMCEGTPFDARIDTFDLLIDPLDSGTEVLIGLQRSPLGVDDAGNVLFVWVERTYTIGEPNRLLIQRHSPTGVQLDAEPVEIPTTSNASAADPFVIGVSTGWVVAYHQLAGGNNHPYMRHIAVDGTVGPRFTMSDGSSQTERRVQLARLHTTETPDAIVALWMRSPDLYARRFDLNITSAAPGVLSARDAAPFMVDRPRRASGFPREVGHVGLAASGADWLVTWDEPASVELASRRLVLGRRFRDAVRLDAEPFELFHVLDGSSQVSSGIADRGTGLYAPNPDDPAAAPLPQGDFAVVFRGGYIDDPAIMRSRLELYTRYLPRGPVTGFPDAVLLADKPEGTRTSLNYPAIIPMPHAPGQVLVAWDFASRTPRVRVHPEFAILSMAPDAGSVAAMPIEAMRLLSYLDDYAGGMSLAASPTSSARGVWASCTDIPILGVDEGFANNSLVAVLFPFAPR